MTERSAPCLSIVVPCYNEEQVLPVTVERLTALLHGLIDCGQVQRESCIYLVDDGSTDQTWGIIDRLGRENPLIRGIKLSRNHGHQRALLAGLMTVPGDAIISIDADLQDDLRTIGEMIDAYMAGSEIVFGVRRARRADSWGKRCSAEGYYRLLSLMGVEVVFNHADYRLMGRRAVEALREFKEINLFLRGLIPQLGFKTTTVVYDREERFAGESKYPLRKMLSLALDGITSFSAVPLRMITVLGIVISFASLLTGMWALWAKLTHRSVVLGWASTVVPIYFLGGMQMLATGVIGQYLAKIFLEVKSRPRFIIEQITPAGDHAGLSSPSRSSSETHAPERMR